ncbi:MAG: cobalamin-binding protein [Chloroflexi bacterium]|nr:cobalamin-binding protein [Chloroflexota bacterium]
MLRKLTFAILTLALFLAACGSATPVATESADTAITLTDGLGRTVTLPAAAQSVVSLTPAGTEMLFAVGAGSQVVGRDMFSDYPAEAASIQDIGGSMGQYNLEAIVALQPDLVLAGGINPPELVASLEDLGLTVYFLPNPVTLEDMYAVLETVGALTGRGSEAAALVESLTARVAAVDAAIMPLSYQPSVYYELDATNPAQPYTAGPGTFVDLLIQRAGGYNIGSGLEGQWATISVEQLLVADPAIILLGDAAYGETPEKVAVRPGWETLSAIQSGQVFAFDDNLVSRPGPRLVDGLEALVEILHPGVLK